MRLLLPAAGVLFFGEELPNGIARGLSADVLLPERHRGDFGEYAVDFSDTTIEASGKGLAVIETTRLENGWRLGVQCPVDDGPGARDLGGEVRAHGQVRYADAIDVECLTPTHATLTTPNPIVVIGSKLWVSVVLSVPSPAKAVAGRGWELLDVDGPLALQHDSIDGANSILSFEA